MDEGAQRHADQLGGAASARRRRPRAPRSCGAARARAARRRSGGSAPAASARRRRGAGCGRRLVWPGRTMRSGRCHGSTLVVGQRGGHVLHHVAQLAHVARPGVARSGAASPPARSAAARSAARAGVGEERARQQRDLARAVAQRRQHHRRRARGGRTDPGGSGRPSPRPRGRGWWRRRRAGRSSRSRDVAEPGQPLRLQHAQQLGLHRRRQLADLVEEHRAAVPPLRAGPPWPRPRR